MNIPADILQKWKQLKAHGDVPEIAKEYKAKRASIANAFRRGTCSDEIFITLTEFYNKRSELVLKAK